MSLQKKTMVVMGTAYIFLIIILYVISQREMYSQGKAGMLQFILWVMAAVLIYSFIISFILRKNEIIEASAYLVSKSEEQALLLENIDIQVWYLTDMETYGAVNKAHADYLGLKKSEIENRKITDIISSKLDVENYIYSNKMVFDSKKQMHFETIGTTNKGESRILSITKTPKLDDKGNVEYVVCSAADITERKKAEEEIRYLSFHDKLTGLYNRAFFEEELERMDTSRQLPLSLIIGDLNGLKLTNDVFGHLEGDKLLKSIARIMKESCRKEDVIARWGGDEFAIILPATDEKTALNKCNRIWAACSQAEANPIQPSIALGTSCKTDAGQDIQHILKEAEDRMYQHKLHEVRSARSSPIAFFEKTLFEKNIETTEHAQRIRIIAARMGHETGLSDSELDSLSLLAALHDIGKIAIPDSILLKPEKLSPDEWETIRKHTEIGYRIAKASSELASIAEAILTHHERWDGKGYPHGLKGEEIQLISRILSIIDAYDAMTSTRPYREATGRQEALEEISRCAGTQFDPQLVDVFLKVMAD